MKKKQKKSKKRLFKSKRFSKTKKVLKKRKRIIKKRYGKSKKKKVIKYKKKSEFSKPSKTQSDSLILKVVKLQLSLKPKFNFKIRFSLEKYIQSFFDKISETISDYRILKNDEKRRLKLEKIENERLEKIAIEKQKKEDETLRLKLKEQALKDFHI